MFSFLAVYVTGFLLTFSGVYFVTMHEDKSDHHMLWFSLLVAAFWPITFLFLISLMLGYEKLWTKKK